MNRFDSCVTSAGQSKSFSVIANHGYNAGVKFACRAGIENGLQVGAISGYETDQSS
jgi:hypothetical protein